MDLVLCLVRRYGRKETGELKKEWSFLLLFVSLLLSACGSKNPTQSPTHTLVPGQPTAIYLTVVNEQATRGIITFTPGFNSAEQAVESTLTTATPRPSFTPQPSSTPRPGYATIVSEGVNGTLAAEGHPTLTPGPGFETEVQEAINSTTTAVATNNR